MSVTFSVWLNSRLPRASCVRRSRKRLHLRGSGVFTTAFSNGDESYAALQTSGMLKRGHYKAFIILLLFIKRNNFFLQQFLEHRPIKERNGIVKKLLVGLDSGQQFEFLNQLAPFLVKYKFNSHDFLRLF